MSSSQSSKSPSPPPQPLKESKDKKKTIKLKDKEKGKSKEKEKENGKDKKMAKAKDKSKKSNTQTMTETTGRNEGQDPNWAYKPPPGMVELDTSQVDEEFDWDALKNDEDKELCLFRIPDGFKAKYLDGLEFSLPSNLNETSQKIITFEKKRSKLEIWSVGTGDNVDDHEREGDTRGQELHNLKCLLPRSKKKGALYIAPKPIVHRFIITHSAAVSSTNAEGPLISTPREAVPAEALKHRFIPLGAASRRPIEEDAMDLEPLSSITTKPPSQKSPSKTHSPRKDGSKKRKSGHGDTESSPKKSKKLKAE